MTGINGSCGVLVVDDEPQILASVRDLLEDKFAVSTATDAEAALLLLEQTEVAVILSDQRMPGLSGDEFLMRAREMSHATRVLITGYSDISALVRAINNGQIYAYVAKPWDPMDFKLTVAKAAEHYKLTQQVHESEQRFRLLFEEAPVAYVEIDRDANITVVNLAASTLLGHSQGDLLGRKFWALMRARSRPLQAIDPDNNSADSSADVLEHDLIHRDGHLISVQLHARSIHDHAGKVTGQRVAIIDITARKIAEQSAKKYAIELMMKNEQLEHTLEHAKEASAIKSQFLARMSHELRTPLNSIIGFSQLMHDGAGGPLSTDHKDFLEDVLASSSQLLQLVNDLLDLEKVESGKLTFSRERVDVKQCLNEVKDVLRSLADEKKISVTLDVDPHLMSVVTDPVRLKQVLYNYLSNAIKFTPEGGAVSITLIREDAANFRLEVTDTGIGIEPENLPRLFSDFVQLEATRKAASQGAGLGLALTKCIVEAQGGIVGVRSTPGQGSTFYAVLPNEEATPDQNERAAELSPHST
jgi:two-component system cell cycle sensor histidine kinase PleC